MVRFLQNAKKIVLRRMIKGCNHSSGNRLIMTLLVRDEADIVRANIEYHLAQGVDFIVATDNGSIDGTDEILEEYQQKGVLHLIREGDLSNRQSQWVNRMGRLALEEFQADIIFHCDADEFWWSHSKSLKNELLYRRSLDALYVGVTNMMLTRTGDMDAFQKTCNYAVTRPLHSDNVGIDSMNKSLYLFTYPGKVMYKTTKGYLEVGRGNHGIIESDVPVMIRDSADLQVIHYPLRSYAQFQEKVINGGSAYEKNPSKEGGWHKRRWYKTYKQGGLPDEFRLLTLDVEEAQKYLKEGVLSDWSSRHRAICSYL